MHRRHACGGCALRDQGTHGLLVQANHVPAEPLVVVDDHRAVNALALLLQLEAVIHAAHVLHENLQHRAGVYGQRRLKGVGLQQLPVVEGGDNLPVQQDHRPVVGGSQLQLAQLALIHEGGAVEGVSVALIQTLHAHGGHAVGGGQVSQQGHQRRGGHGPGLTVGTAGDGRHIRLRGLAAGSGFHRLPEQPVLLGDAAVLGEQRVVVVGCHVGGQAVVVVCAVHQAEAGAAVEHVHVHMAQLEGLGEVLRADLRRGGGVSAVAPVVEPAAPEFHAHLRLNATLRHEGELLLRAGAEVPRLEHAVHLAAGQHVMGGAVGGNQGHIDAPGDHAVPQSGQVGLVIAVGAVLVLHLHHDDRPAVGDLQGYQAGHQLIVVVHDVAQVARIAAAQADTVLLQQPGGQAAKLPLGADVGRGPQDDVQPQLLGQADEALHVVHAGEVEFALAGLVEVPGDVGFHGVHAQGAELQQPVAPVFGGYAEVVDGAGNHLEGLAVQEEAVVADLKGGHGDSSFFGGRGRGASCLFSGIAQGEALAVGGADRLREDRLGQGQVFRRIIDAVAEMGQNQLSGLGLAGQRRCLVEDHVMVAQGLGPLVLVPVHALQDHQIRTLTHGRDGRDGPGVRGVEQGHALPGRAGHVLRADDAALHRDGLALLERFPLGQGNAQRPGLAGVEGGLPGQVQPVAQAGDAVIQREAGNLQADQAEGLPGGQLMQHHRVAQRGRNHPQPLHDPSEPHRAVDVEGLLPAGLVEGQQQPGQAAAVVAMVVGDQQPVHTAETPAQAADAHLRALAAVDQQRFSARAHVQAGQGAVGQGKGSAGPQGAAFQHGQR